MINVWRNWWQNHHVGDFSFANIGNQHLKSVDQISNLWLTQIVYNQHQCSASNLSTLFLNSRSWYPMPYPQWTYILFAESFAFVITCPQSVNHSVPLTRCIWQYLKWYGPYLLLNFDSVIDLYDITGCIRMALKICSNLNANIVLGIEFRSNRTM